MNKYTINSTSEESNCTSCGMPLYVGDTAYMRDDDQIVCGLQCDVELIAYETGYPRCPACDNSDNTMLGILGNLAHFRCDNCGIEFSHKIG